MELLDGKWLSQEIKKDIAAEVKKIIAQGVNSRIWPLCWLVMTRHPRFTCATK